MIMNGKDLEGGNCWLLKKGSAPWS